MKAQPELVEDIVYPAALGCRAQISEDLGEMREQLRKQLDRIRELRVRRVEEPGITFVVDFGIPHRPQTCF